MKKGRRIKVPEPVEGPPYSHRLYEMLIASVWKKPLKGLRYLQFNGRVVGFDRLSHRILIFVMDYIKIPEKMY